ncbi:MAG: hypothetical protein WBN29_13590, partial [Polyangiales bacterium]
MRNPSVTALTLALLSAFSTTSARAQEELDLALQPDTAAGYKLNYEEFEIQELERTSLRSRNALIGT